MKTPFVDNCYGDAQLPDSATELAARLRQLQKQGSDQTGSGRTRLRINAQQRHKILQETANRCHICGGAITDTDYFEVDHVYPAAAGGSNKTDNLLPAHGLCNTVKSNRQGEEFQWVLKIGVWAKKHMQGESQLGEQMLKLFYEQELKRVKRQKPAERVDPSE